MNPLQPSLHSAAIRLILAWALLSALGAWLGHGVIDSLIPFLTTVTDAITTDFSALLKWDDKNAGMLTIAATFEEPNPSIQALGINVGARVRAGTNIEHVLVPVVLLYGVLFAWPVSRTSERVLLLVIGLPTALFSLALTTPFLLTGKVESLLQIHATKSGVVRAEPFHLTWMLFTEAGGRWLIPIVLGVICVRVVFSVVAPKLVRAESAQPLHQRAQENTARAD